MITIAEQLKERIRTRTARLAIVGLGHVGLPTALAYAEAGFDVTGVDLDARKREGINAGRSHVGDVSDAAIQRSVASRRFRAVTALGQAGDLDVIDICVPTPLDKSREPDVSAIVSVVDEATRLARPGMLILLTSTTYPGTTVELVQPALEASGLTVGREIFLAFAPERIDPGNAVYGLRNTPKVVGGVTPACTELAAELLGTIVDRLVPVSDATTAEVTKLLENTFRSINIGLANETAMMCRLLGVDVWEVIASAGTKPYGFMPFYPGPGIGGHCIPVDPSYFAWKLKRLNYTARFIELANEINRHMPEYVVDRIAELLNDDSRSIKGSRILLLGMAYKPNVDDVRESPAVDVARLLHKRGAQVAWSDPHVRSAPLDGDMDPHPVEPTADVLSKQDLVVITTDHEAFDWDLVRTHARLVFDTRGVSRRQGHNGWHVI